MEMAQSKSKSEKTLFVVGQCKQNNITVKRLVQVAPNPKI